MTAALIELSSPSERREAAAELYLAGLSLRQVAGRLGVSHNMVKKYLLSAGVTLRRPGRPVTTGGGSGGRGRRPKRHLRLVPDERPRQPPPLLVPPERAAMAYTADRGWHMVQAPPGWFLELLAELD